jgi:hypothetical protein
MRFLAAFLLFTATCFSQTAPKSSSPAKPLVAHHCEPELGFCFDDPPAWKKLGEVYDGHGVSVAPPQQGEPSQWAQVTVATIAVPTQEGKNPPTVEDLVTSLVGKMAEQSANMETVRRSETTLAQRPAQLLQVHYDENGDRWGETIVALDGGTGNFYVIAYKARASQEAKYKTEVEGILKSFRLTQ